MSIKLPKAIANYLEVDKERDVVRDFPGSSGDLRYFFILNGDQIAEREIVS